MCRGNARRDVELAKDVAKVGFHGLLAEVELRRYLSVGLAVDDEPRQFLLGVMLGLAALAVASLIAMAWWVRNRGRFGSVASPVLRSLYAVVLGLGGWLLGVLLVLATMPGVSLDSQVMAVVAVGGPIALGVYWAWVHREWTARTKAVGCLSAVIGAFAGAWLGWHATSGLMAMPTAIVGAVLGSNLALIALDVFDVPAVGLAIGSPTGQRPEPAHLAR